MSHTESTENTEMYILKSRRNKRNKRKGEITELRSTARRGTENRWRDSGKAKSNKRNQEFAEEMKSQKLISSMMLLFFLYLTLLYRYRASDFQFPFGPSTSVLRDIIIIRLIRFNSLLKK